MKSSLNLLRLIPLIMVFCAIMFSCTTSATKPEIKPNILLINIDDMGWKDVGFMGSTFYETPNIDQLAKQGVIFDQAYAGAANCAPSRACLMSGEWTPRHGVYTVDTSERGKAKDRKLIPTKNKYHMDETYTILPQILKAGGYATCHAGKWHVTMDPATKGFDVNIGGNEHGNPGSYYPPYKRVPSLTPTQEGQYLTDLVMDKTLEFVEQNSDKPFFLYYSPYAVHTPIQPVKSLLDKYEAKEPSNGQDNAKYATMVENLDRNIGRLITLLKEKDLFENTFIFFTSDNGGVYFVTKQRPLRAGKGSYYEGGVREPTFATWKGKIKGGQISKTPITNMDIFPTLLDIAGIEKPADKNLDGVSLANYLLKNEPVAERSLYWHFPIYLQGGNAECQDNIFRTRPGSSILAGDWKLIQYFENNDIELYNLADDINESNNMAASNPEKVAELLKDLDSWRKRVNAPVPTELNPKYEEVGK